MRDREHLARTANPTLARVYERAGDLPQPLTHRHYVAHFVGHAPIVGTSRVVLQASAKKQRLLLVGIERVRSDFA